MTTMISRSFRDTRPPHVRDPAATTLIDCLAGALAVGSFVAAMLVLSTSFAVADNSGVSACADLDSKVGAAERTQQDASRERVAAYLATEARSLCETQHASEGVGKYQQALSILQGTSAATVEPPSSKGG
jgi:hypothetical protein